MLFLIATSILFCSFLYGLSVGLKKPAYAAMKIDNSTPSYSLDGLSDLPEGIKLIPIGDNVSIKGHQAIIANFFTARSVEDVLNEQREIWERKGIKPVGAVSSSRGALVGDDQANRQRLMMMMWEVPPSIQKISNQGYPFQGMISRISNDTEIGSDGEQFVRGLGIPPKPGSEKGVVFSSRDNGVESRTASFLNSGNIADNVSFYETNLRHKGWQLTAKERLGEGSLGLIKLDFAQQEQLLHVLITPIDNQSFISRDGVERSFVNVTRVFVAQK